MALAGSERSYTGTFFIVSQLLVILTVYALIDEFFVRRPWKDYQSEFNTLQLNLAQKELASIRKTMADQRVSEQITNWEQIFEDVQEKIEGDELTGKIKELDALKEDYADDESDVKDDKSRRDSYYYEYKHAMQSGHSFAEEKKRWEQIEVSIKAQENELAKLAAKIVALQTEINNYAAKSFYDSMAARSADTKKPLEKAVLEDIKRYQDEQKAFLAAGEQLQGFKIMDPVKEIGKKIDALKKPEVDAVAKVDAIKTRVPEINQIVVNDFGKGGNIAWGRVDRCLTCHVSNNRPGFEDVTKSFGLTVVPDKAAMDKLVAEKPETKEWVVTERQKKYLTTMYGTHPKQELLAKHPTEQYGCTSCHGGDGRGLYLNKKDVFGHGDKAHAFHHHAMEPLLRGKQMESNCLACHNGKMQIQHGQNISKGVELFVQLGCQNCHAVDGYDKLYRVGPELNKVTQKVTESWLVDWIKNPHNYMPNTRMPNFGLKDDEVTAIASYLTANSVPHRLQKNYSGGNVQNGEKLFNSVGCIGCHSAQSDPQTYATRALRGPNLSRISAKMISAAWVYDWIKNPKNYSEHARMPSLRLKDSEAADITAYLWAQSPGYKTELEKRAADLAKQVNPDDKDKVALGQKLVNQRGCYSCHLMKGFEDGERIGPNLTAEALKEGFEFDAGDSLKDGYTFNDVYGRKVYVAHLEELKPDTLAKAVSSGAKTLKKYVHSHHLGETAGEPTAAINARAKEIFTTLDPEGTKDANDVTNIQEEHWQSWIRNKLKYPMEMYAHERADLKMPNFDLSDDELDSLLVFLKGLTNRKVTYAFNASMREQNQRIVAGEQILAEKNCLACHSVYTYWDGANKKHLGFGGEINDKIDQVSHQDMNSGLFPPDLTRVGEKIRPEWLTEYLADPSLNYRLAVAARMPTFDFDDTQVNTLVQYFAALSGRSPVLKDTDYELNQTYVQAGKLLADGKLICNTCHFIDGRKPDTDPIAFAPEWKLMRERLQSDFITDWIKMPGDYQSHTPMPGFFSSDPMTGLVQRDPTGKVIAADDSTVSDVLDGKGASHLEALKQYILSIGDKRSYDEMKSSYPNTSQTNAAPAPTEETMTTGVEINGGVY